MSTAPLTKTYLATSYAIAALFLAAATWLTWEWHWAIRLVLLAYLLPGTALFPIARLPAESLVVATALWSPVELTGLIAFVPRALVYLVVWGAWIVFAPIGGIMLWSAQQRAPEQSASHR